MPKKKTKLKREKKVAGHLDYQNLMVIVDGNKNDN